MGEQAWQARQQQQLILRYNHYDIESLFAYYKSLCQVFATQQAAKPRPDGSVPDKSAQVQQEAKAYEAAGNQYNEADHVLSTLAPTPQAQLLNKKADALLDTWVDAHPANTSVVLSAEAMKGTFHHNPQDPTGNAPTVLDPNQPTIEMTPLVSTTSTWDGKAPSNSPTTPRTMTANMYIRNTVNYVASGAAGNEAHQYLNPANP